MLKKEENVYNIKSIKIFLLFKSTTKICKKMHFLKIISYQRTNCSIIKVILIESYDLN